MSVIENLMKIKSIGEIYAREIFIKGNERPQEKVTANRINSALYVFRILVEGVLENLSGN